jgi:hypothetical protein
VRKVIRKGLSPDRTRDDERSPSIPLPIDGRDQVLDPDIIAVEQGSDELCESVIRVGLQHAGEKIADIRRRAVSQQRYRRMVPHERMSRIDTKRLTQKGQCVFVPIHQIV